MRISQQPFGQSAWEMVRLKGLDPYFQKIKKKKFILPQSPLVSAAIEEGQLELKNSEKRSTKPQKFANIFFSMSKNEMWGIV